MSSHTLIAQFLTIGSDIWDMLSADTAPHEGNTLTYTLHDAVRLRGERRRQAGSPESLRRTPLQLAAAGPLSQTPGRLGMPGSWGRHFPDSVACRAGWKMLIVLPRNPHSRHILK